MTETSYREKQPKVFWPDTIFRHSDSLDDATVMVLQRQEKRGRTVEYHGLEHIPKEGGCIIAANHFVRMKDKSRALGPHKMEDLFASVGALTTAVRKQRGEHASVIWTPSRVPRPEAVFKGKSAKDTLEWIASGSPLLGVSNVVRTLFLSLYKGADDVLPTPHDAKQREHFFETLQARLKNGEVLGIFPEGEVSHAMRRGRFGVAHIAIRSGVPVIPVAQYDRGGDLIVTVGESIQPPTETSGARPLLHSIMHAISGMLPPELRGVYTNTGSIEL